MHTETIRFRDPEPRPCVTPGCQRDAYVSPVRNIVHVHCRTCLERLARPTWLRRADDPAGMGATMLRGKDLTGVIGSAA